MGDQTKKISFGFSKLAKKTSIVSTQLNKNTQNDDVSKIEFIDCLEGKSIKLKDPVKIDQGPLIIPLSRQKPDTKLNQHSTQTNSNSQDVKLRLENQDLNCPKSNNLKFGREEEKINTTTVNNSDQTKPETLDDIAAKEILEELNQRKAEDDEKRVFSVPLTSNAPSGEKESTLEDYDNVPVGEFGMAMLRGMGWAPGKGIGKSEKLIAPSLPLPRPKGMGLGADKVIKSAEKKSSNEDLKMIKGSFIRVLAGTEKDSYGQVEGFDDESGRLIVKLALKNISVSLNEFMVQLVDAQEFKKNSKVINVSKYEKYKQDEKKKENYEGTSIEKDHEGSFTLSPRQSRKDGKHKPLMKNYSSSCDSEEGYEKDRPTQRKVASSEESRPDKHKRTTRSPSSTTIIRGTKSKELNSQSKTHESGSKNIGKNLARSEKKQRSVSSDSSNSSSSNRKVNENKHNSARAKTTLKNRSSSGKRSSSSSSSSDSSGNYYRKKKSKYNKKKSCSNKYRRRSRSRSPRKHKHKSK